MIIFQISELELNVMTGGHKSAEHKQLILLLEEKLDKSEGIASDLQNCVDNYQQKYTQCTEQIAQLEQTFTEIQQELHEATEKVCT